MIEHIYALSQYFMTGSSFYIISSDDINNPTSFKIAQHFTNNTTFPALIPSDETTKAMIHNSYFQEKGNIHIPVG